MNKISIVIVTFNSAKTIKVCIDSIIEFTSDYEIIVVDNNSSDNTCKILQSYGNKVILIQSNENLGFSKANNLGVKSATGEYLIFLNPDTRIMEKDSLEKLAVTLKSNEDYGIIGPKLVYPDGSIQARVRNLPTVLKALQEYILNKKGTYDFYLPGCKTLCEVESIIGACMVAKKDLFERVGGFDEKYFMYFEDLELCKKVRSLGMKVGFLPEVVVEHAEGKSGVNQKTYELMKISAKKYFSPLTFYLLELIFFYNRILNKVRVKFGQSTYS